MFGVIVKLVSFIKQVERFHLCGYHSINVISHLRRNVDFIVDYAQ